MAHTGLFATSDEILVMAGEDYDTSVTEARINAMCLQAESLINSTTRYNWSDEFTAPATTTLNADVWYLLTIAEATWVAMQIVNYNPTAYSGGQRAVETQLDFLKSTFDRVMELLKDQEVKTFMAGA